MKNRFKKTICAALAALTALSAAACGNTSNPSNTDTDDTDISTAQADIAPVKLSASPVSAVELKADSGSLSADFNTAYTGFTAELFKNACAQDIASGKNVLISPESVMFALGMTANGANGETLIQMENALGGEKIDALNNDLLCLMHKANDDESAQLRIANSIWTNKSLLALKQDYADKLREYYAADSFNEEFTNKTADDINGWISNNTNGMIPKMIDSIDPNDAAFLVNAAAFDAQWAKKFEGEDIKEDCKFTAFDGSKQNCTLLSSEENIYLHDDDTKGFVKLYKGGNYGFMALLPNDSSLPMADYVSSLDAEKLGTLWNTRESTSVDTVTPEFTSDYNIKMNDALINMGMTDAFDNADFSNMAVDSSDLKIAKVLHSTHIEVDRNGTKAAAATVVEMNKESAVLEEEPKPYVRLDRPFVYAIVDMENGTPIFIGAVNTVE